MYFKRLKTLREINNFSKQEISTYLNVNLTTYEKWETGKSKIPISMIIKLCILYDVSADYILELIDEKLPLTKH